MPTFSYSSRGASRAILKEEVEVRRDNCNSTFGVSEKYYNFDTIGENEYAGDLDFICQNCGNNIQIWFRSFHKQSKEIEYKDVGLSGAELTKGFGKEAEVGEVNKISLIRKVFSENLIKLIASNPNHLQDIEWRELEHLIAVAFEKFNIFV